VPVRPPPTGPPDSPPPAADPGGEIETEGRSRMQFEALPACQCFQVQGGSLARGMRHGRGSMRCSASSRMREEGAKVTWSVLLGCCSTRLRGTGAAASPRRSRAWAPLKERLQRGVSPWCVCTAALTVVELATWDPGSRAVLPAHDQLQAQLAEKGVRFVMVSEESPKAVQTYLDWAKPSHLAVACDGRAALRGALLDPYSGLPIPYVIITSSTRAADPGTVLWSGPVTLREDSFMSWYEGYSTPSMRCSYRWSRPLDMPLRGAVARRTDLAARRWTGEGARAVRTYIARVGRTCQLRWPARSPCCGGVSWRRTPTTSTLPGLPGNRDGGDLAADHPPVPTHGAPSSPRRRSGAGGGARRWTMQRPEFRLQPDGPAEYHQALPRNAAEEAAPPAPPETITRERCGGPARSMITFARIMSPPGDDTTWDSRCATRAHTTSSTSRALRRAEAARDFGLPVEYLRIFRDQNRHHNTIKRAWSTATLPPGLSHFSPTCGPRSRPLRDRRCRTASAGAACPAATCTRRGRRVPVPHAPAVWRWAEYLSKFATTVPAGTPRDHHPPTGAAPTRH
jgi:hypothetical protein